MHFFLKAHFESKLMLIADPQFPENAWRLRLQINFEIT